MKRNTQLSASQIKDIIINSQTDSYTLIIGDADKIIDMNKSSAMTLTIPKNSAVAFGIGTTIAVRQSGVGAITITPIDGDVTVNSENGLATNGQYAIISLLKVDTNTWTVCNGLSEATLKTYFDTLYKATFAYTAEDVANKSTNVVTDGSSDTKYPSVKATKDYADNLVIGLLDYRGAFNASGNTYPVTGGSGSGETILKGDTWAISVAGVLDGIPVTVGDALIAIVDNPDQTPTNWNILNTNIGYVPEDQANKSTDGALTDNSTTKYPSQSAVKTYADGKISKTTAGEIFAMTDKPTPLDADVTLIESDANSNAKRKLTWANIKATLLTYFYGFFPKSDGTVNPTNLIFNGSLECHSAGVTAAPDGFAKGGSPTLAVDTGDIGYGAVSQKITLNAPGEDIHIILTGLKASTTYSVSYRTKVTAGDTSRVATTDAAVNMPATDSTSTTWETKIGKFTTDASGTNVILYFYSPTAGDVIWFDGAMCVEGSSAFAFSDKPASLSAPSFTNGISISNVPTVQWGLDLVGVANTVILADDGTCTLSTGAGLISVTVAATGSCALVIGFSGEQAILWQNGADFTTTLGTDNKINVGCYASSYYRVENKMGTSITAVIATIRLKASA
jgi:hypothetical protein